MSANSNNDRLPPPAFPPGSRRHVHRNSVHPPERDGRPEGHDASSDDPFISPDEPLPQRRDAVQRAFISPDDPLPPRAPGGGPAGHGETLPFIRPDDPLPARGRAPEEEGIATGMGESHLMPDELAGARDPHVAEILAAVGKLVEAVRRKGEAGLRTTPGMTRFEATLRSYCVGYLAGRRAESEEGAEG